MFFLEKKQQKSKKKNLENLIFFLFFCIKILIFCLFFLSFYHENCILTGLFTLIVKYTLFLVLLFVQMFSSHLTTKNTTINEKKNLFSFVFFLLSFFLFAIQNQVPQTIITEDRIIYDANLFLSWFKGY